jgi:ubiquinone/menaquinone biosynthesis C-methylase UbiE
MPGFDRLAPWYRAVEFLAFGRDLERARFQFLPRIAGATEILLLGEGDGRCAERLAGLAPRARITCVDSSPGMIRRAQARLAGHPAGDRVHFVCADVFAFEPGPRRFDAVATLFFLDCFDPSEVGALVPRVGSLLAPDAPWLFADFRVPPAGWARLRAQAWLAFLYAFFRWETSLRVSTLPPSEEILAAHGWAPAAGRDFQHGLLRSAVYERARGPTAARAPSA